jgi:hypothetical protein
MDQRQEVNRCLNHLGNYWRGNWSEFHGPTLQHQLSNISQVMSGEKTADEFCDDLEIR